MADKYQYKGGPQPPPYDAGTSTSKTQGAPSYYSQGGYSGQDGNNSGQSQDRVVGASGALAFSEQSVRLGFIKKVYGILTLQLLVTAGIVALFILVEPIKVAIKGNLFLLISALYVLVVFQDVAYFLMRQCLDSVAVFLQHRRVGGDSGACLLRGPASRVPDEPGPAGRLHARDWRDARRVLRVRQHGGGPHRARHHLHRRVRAHHLRDALQGALATPLCWLFVELAHTVSPCVPELQWDFTWLISIMFCVLLCLIVFGILVIFFHSRVCTMSPLISEVHVLPAIERYCISISSYW